MRFLVQWARSEPTDWDEVDSRQWRSLPAKPDPTGGDFRLDDYPGWVNALNVQGTVFSGHDHYHIKHVDLETCIVTVWCDDPSDYGPGERYAMVWTIKTLAPDPLFNGAINTRQTSVVYAESKARTSFEVRGRSCLPWRDFVPPTDGVKHGKALDNAAYQSHRIARRIVGWREFTDGLPESELVDGKVPSQRRLGRYFKPKGSRTYYASNTALATDVHLASNELAFLTGTGEAAEVIESIAKAKEELAFCFTSPVNEPNSGDWPSGNYRYWIDCSTCGANISYGLLTLNGTEGHFARVDGGLTTDLETWPQTDGAYTNPGLKQAQTGTIDPSIGNATDRWEALICAANSNTKDAQDFGITLNETDDYTDGPWPMAALQANAQCATAAADAVSPTATPGAVSASAQLAAADADAVSPTATPGGVQAAAQLAQANTDALAPTAMIAISAPAEVTTADADALPSAASPGEVQVAAGFVGAQADALAAGATVPESADAQVATAAADAVSPTVTPGGVSASAGLAQAAADALASTVAPGSVSVTAQFAQAQADAPNAGAQITVGLQADAQVAQAQIDACPPTIDPGWVQVGAAFATAGTDALDATVQPGEAQAAGQPAEARVDVLPISAELDAIQVVAQAAQAFATASWLIASVPNITAAIDLPEDPMLTVDLRPRSQ